MEEDEISRLQKELEEARHNTEVAVSVIRGDRDLWEQETKKLRAENAISRKAFMEKYKMYLIYSCDGSCEPGCVSCDSCAEIKGQTALEKLLESEKR